MAKLKNHRAFERPTMFTDNIYFPFQLCVVKCGEEGINYADRQNMHSSSLAVNAIIQLYGALGEDKVRELSGYILVFLISHDNERVKLYDHFAVIEGEKTSFYRYAIASFVLNFEENQDPTRTHDFVREIYHTFYPAHLKRVRYALAAMKDPRTLSMTSHMSVEDSESQEQDPSAQSSQEIALGFKKPGVPASKKQKNEMALLRGQLIEQQKLSKGREAALMTQLEQQCEQQKELMKMLKQLLDR